ncbi:hypothetical protein BJX63DRAFT_366537 [Aspergillus granulosus]|uniref:B30.2/SPRY domain-containing protein n=1 Tax=Aspergillus granulosus TaxID=176169 RepID=A0ABR4H1D4_9EURO
MPVLDPNLYTVAWIAPLEIEVQAARHMLDKVHSGGFPVGPGDDYVFHAGEIHGHNVVIATFAAGQTYGTNSATALASHVRKTFPNLWFGLLVGVAAGLPNLSCCPPRDIRLGDVIVALPDGENPAIVPYGLGKQKGGIGFELLRSGHSLPQTERIVCSAIGKIKAERRDAQAILGYYKSITHTATKFPDPGQEHDVLISSSDNKPIQRPCRPDAERTRVWYGSIGSGDKLLKSHRDRDEMRDKYNVIGLEMEAAGVLNEIPVGNIRGVCDYGDEHKNKDWQPYAAAMAAAYAKAVLSEIPPKSAAQAAGYKSGAELTSEEKECLQSLFLTDPAEDRTILQRRKGDRADGTCDWILETDELMQWLGVSETRGPKRPEVLWLHGHPGTGKSTMVMAMTEALPNRPWFANSQRVLAYFFCDAGSEKQRTAIAIMRGLIYHLVKECPALMKHLLPKYIERKATLYTSFDTLWSVLTEMSQKSSVEIYCIIDALDECESDSQEMLLCQLHRTFQKHRPTDTSSSYPHFLITSRPYPEIGGYLFSFRNKDLATYSAVKSDLTVMIKEKVKDLAERKKYTESVRNEVIRILETKSEGTFLWVGIVCNELARPGVQSRNAVKTLERMPPGLHALYRQLLNTAFLHKDGDDDDRQTMVDILRFVAFARRPLTVLELAVVCELYPDSDEATRLQFTQELIDLCRLMIVIQDKHVRLLHKSVKDFLVKEDLDIDELGAHADMAGFCIDHILHDAWLASDGKSTFLEYAVEYWPEHAEHADTAYVINRHQESFFKPESIIWEKWLGRYNSKGRRFGKLEEGFGILHAAARWGIIPLITWGLKTAVGSTEFSHSDEGSYNDAEFATEDGLTPLEVAARQGRMNVMDILLKEMRAGLKVSEQVLKAAARNEESGGDVMALLLDRQGDQIKITEDVVLAAARNEGSGKHIMKLLLDQQGDQIETTEEVITAAAGNERSGKDIIRFLLDQIEITEDVVMAAARNEGSGKDIMELLLDQQGDQIEITEDVVKAAVANKWSGKSIMNLLLDRQGDQISITPDIFKTAVGNDYSGGALTKSILLRIEDQIKEGQCELHRLCLEGNVGMVKSLLNIRSTVNTPNCHGWTPLHAACLNGHTDLIKILCCSNASINATSNTGWSSLDVAFARGHTDIIRILLQHSDDTDCLSPTCFSDVKSSVLDLSQDKLSVEYVGLEQKGSLDAAPPGLIYADHPVSYLEDEFYFEIEIVSLGQSGEIGLGLCIDGSPTDIFPGWNYSSWGYHGDDGHKHHSGKGHPYGQMFQEGDIIGCYLEVSSGTLKFNVNDCCLGDAFTNVHGYLFPVVAMSSYGAQIRANFTGPFIYSTKKDAKFFANGQTCPLIQGECDQTQGSLESSPVVVITKTITKTPSEDEERTSSHQKQKGSMAENRFLGNHPLFLASRSSSPVLRGHDFHEVD